MQQPAPVHAAAAWLAGAFVLLPWAYRIPWDTSRAILLVLVSPALWLGRDLLTRRLEQLFAAGRPTLLLCVVFGAAVVFSIIGSTHWAASLTTAATWCILGLASILTAELVKDSRAARLLLGAIVAGFAVGTAVHWFRWKTGLSLQDAFYLHPRLMGLHGMSAALAAVALVAHTWSHRAAQRALWFGIGTVSWAGLLWTGSRSPLVGIAAGLLVWAVKLRGRERKRLLLSAGALCAAGMLLSAAFWTDVVGFGWWHLAQRTALTQSSAQITSNRSSFWADALTHVQASPLIGYGPDAYGFLTPQLEGAQPHNLLLQLALDVGLPGALAALGLVAVCLWRGWRTPAGDAAGTAWLALAVAAVTSAQFDGYFYYPIAALCAWLALGACASRPNAPQTTLAPSASAVLAWATLAAGAAAVLLLNCLLFQRAVHGTPPSHPDAAAARLWRAFPSVTFNIDTWVDAWSERFPERALETSRFARRHSQSPELFRVKSAQLLAKQGQLADAVAELELALHEARPEQKPAVAHVLRTIRARSTQP